MSRPTPPLPEHLQRLRDAVAAQFSVEQQLGVGGMGTVLLARDLALDRLVAIKVVSPEVALTVGVRERFLREARTVARLRHPNIVAVYSAGEAAGMLYFVMEYVPGESLRELIARQGPCDPAIATRILGELAAALEHAHAAGVVHRDIKPENVLIEEGTGTARLTDFGVALAVAGAGDDRLTGTGLAIGTPRYMSPEQATGEREIDGRSDVYALGLLGYEMLTGAPAFSGSGPSVVVRQITERPAPVSERVPGVNRDLADAIDRALEKDPAERWQTAAAMAAAVSGGAPVDRPGRASGRSSLRGARLAGAIAAALLLLVLSGLALSRLGGAEERTDPRRSLLVLPFTNLTRTPELDWLREGSVSMLAFDLGQWRDLSVVGFERTLDLVRSAEMDASQPIGLRDAISMARSAGVGTVVTGSIDQRADSITVEARAYDTRTESLVRHARVAAASDADPRTLFDHLSRELLDYAGAPASAVRPGLAATTTTSLEAFRHYVDGVRLLNSWQLEEADSAFQLAIAADSTFALAYYKRAIGRGWRSEMTDTLKLELARQASAHAGRLPARERGLIEAYVVFSEGDFAAARDRYSALVERDSTDAEAWYGLGDAYFHSDWDESRAATMTRSIRAFARTLALDSSQHLAYAHKVEFYTNAARLRYPMVLSGDSVIALRTRADLDRVGPPRVVELRREAGQLAVRTAQRWVLGDPRAPTAVTALATAQEAAGDLDGALQTLERGMRQREVAAAVMPYRIAGLRMKAQRADALAALREALDRVSADSLRAEMSGLTMPTLFTAMSVASFAGSSRDLARVIDATRTVLPPTLPMGGLPTAASDVLRPMQAFLLVAGGDDSQPTRRLIDQAIAAVDSAPEQARAAIRSQYAGLPYLAYLVHDDVRYHEAYDRWAGGASSTLAALAAARSGDTTAAWAIARDFRGVDSLGGPFAGNIRPIGEAMVLIELGDAEGALRILAAHDTRYFDVDSPDPRWAAWVYSFFLRGTLYERLGRREEALAAYRRFIELREHADGAAAAQAQAARESVARLGDASASGS